MQIINALYINLYFFFKFKYHIIIVIAILNLFSLAIFSKFMLKEHLPEKGEKWTKIQCKKIVIKIVNWLPFKCHPVPSSIHGPQRCTCVHVLVTLDLLCIFQHISQSFIFILAKNLITKGFFKVKFMPSKKFKPFILF